MIGDSLRVDLPLAMTMGDGAGVGPEIAARCALKFGGGQRLLAIGSANVMRRAADLVGDLKVRAIADVSEAGFEPGVLDALDISPDLQLPDFGHISAASGQAAYDAIVCGIDLAKSGAVAGIVTAPINKAALAAAGLKYPGHTEILAEHSNTGRVAMMLGNDEVRTVLVTIHCSMRDALDMIDIEAELTAIRFAHEGAKALGYAMPRVAVAGLNPHAGEGGLFGREEIEIIGPAIERARSEGINVSGPWPGDTVFMQARLGEFDVVVAQYHDQGLIPVKYMGLERGVNITLGLPFVRTSPDHGTAFDIAGKGIADPASMITAFEYAQKLAAAKATR